MALTSDDAAAPATPQPLPAPSGASRTDARAVMDQARDLGIPVIERGAEVARHPRSDELVGAVSGGVLVSLDDDEAVVAWPADRPLPADADLDRLSARLVPRRVVVALCDPDVFASLTPRRRTPRRGIAEAIVSAAVAKGSSDLHLKEGDPPYIRLAGELCALGDAPIGREDLVAVATELGDTETEDPAQRDADFSTDVAGVRVRVNRYYARGLLCLAVRILPASVPKLATLGLPPVVETVLSAKRGIVLVAGPTGSGKSTSLAAMATEILERRNCLMVTIEDPVEYLIAPRRGVVRQREVGADTESFARGLRAAMREDPDVILVGEMRDTETMAAALTAAETGHLVLTTVHAADVRSVVERVVDAFPAAQQTQAAIQLSGSLALVLCQALVRRADDPSRRALLYEAVAPTTAVRRHVAERSYELLRSEAQTAAHGSVSWERCLATALERGTIDADTALALAPDTALLERYAQSQAGGSAALRR